MTGWKKNFIVIWISQFFSIMGFSFCMPFNAYYMQETLGVTDPVMLKIYVTIFAAAAPFSIAIFSPIWGAVADRFGRRPMMLRAYTGAAFFLYLMGMADSVALFISLRFLQGVLTGTMTAAQAMVAVQTPKKHSGFALGALSSAVFTGSMAGFTLGGLSAEYFGYQNSFSIAALILMVSVLLIVFGTTENFEKPSVEEMVSTETKEGRFSMNPVLASIIPLLLVVGFASFARRFHMAMMPLLVQEIHGTLEGSSIRFSGIMAGATMAGAVSPALFGYLSDRMKPVTMLLVISVTAWLIMMPMALARTLSQLAVFRIALAFAVGGYSPVLMGWITRTTPDGKRGLVFGWIARARGIGWMFAPIISGAVATVFSVRVAFFAGSLVSLAIIPVLLFVGKRAYIKE